MNPFIFDEFPILETERLILREPKEEDVDPLFQIYREEEAMKYYGIYSIEDRKKIFQLIQQYKQNFREQKSIRFAICLKKNNLCIGSCGYHNWQKGFFRGEIGYELHPHYWRQGYMKEALSAMLAFGYREFALNRIEALVYPENHASEALLHSLHFSKEACLKEYAFFRERFQDLNLFSLFQRDFENEDSLVSFYPISEDRTLTYVVIQAFCKDGFVYVRHKDRTSLEIPGGHIELLESPNMAADRELQEETGATSYTLYPFCDYGVRRKEEESFGRLYGAKIDSFGSLFHEIEEVSILKRLPQNLTYPKIQPYLYQRGLREMYRFGLGIAE